jgi:hypothetical protein
MFILYNGLAMLPTNVYYFRVRAYETDVTVYTKCHLPDETRCTHIVNESK